MFDKVLVTVDGGGPAVTMKEPQPLLTGHSVLTVCRQQLIAGFVCTGRVDCSATSWKHILPITTSVHKIGTYVTENLYNLPAVPVI